jgi:hypothetical protein
VDRTDGRRLQGVGQFASRQIPRDVQDAADSRVADPAGQGIDGLLFLGPEPLAQRVVGTVPLRAAHARTTTPLVVQADDAFSVSGMPF